MYYSPSRRQPIANTIAQHPPVSRAGDFMIAGAGATASLPLALRLPAPRLRRRDPRFPHSVRPAKPGNILVERRGSVLLIGIERPEAQNRFDAPMLIGLGEAYYRLGPSGRVSRGRALRRRPRLFASA